MRPVLAAGFLVAVLCLSGCNSSPQAGASPGAPASPPSAPPGPAATPMPRGPCAGLASTHAAVLLQVLEPNGTAASALEIEMLREWTRVTSGKTDSSGCVAFDSIGAGEYEFTTQGGCARQGTATQEWNGTGDLEITMVTQDVCQGS